MSVALNHIKKYNALNGKYANSKTVLKVLEAMQKDMVSQAIRAIDPHAAHILTVQDKLINLVEKLNGKAVRLNIDKIEIPDGLGALPEGFTRADETIKEIPDTFTLPGEIGKFMGNLQRYKLAVSITGDFHGGKSEYAKQLINAFATKGMTVGLLDLEQGGMISKDTKESLDRNIDKKNLKRIGVSGEIENGLDSVKALAKQFDVLVIDSWQKLDEPSTRFDELRNEFPNTIFIVIFQQNAEGGTRGGSSSDFDAPVALKANRIDPYDFTKNYVSIKKNRGNRTDLIYYIADKQTKEIETILTPKQDD